MKRYTMLALALCTGLLMLRPGSARGQDGIEIIGSLRFFVPDGSQRKIISYGVGTKYTDTTDYEETLVPAIPPVQLYAWLNRPCDGEFAGDPCQWEQDYRGIPDSVSSEELDRFSITYDVGIYNETGGTIDMAIAPSDWPEHVDSIHIEDVILPRAFSHTFTGPVQVSIDDPFTLHLKVVVYYNLATASVNEERSSLTAGLNILPNPLNGEDITLHAPFVPGDRVVVSDMLGRAVNETAVSERSEEMRIPLGDVAPGTYVVARLNERGEIVGRDILQVVR